MYDQLVLSTLQQSMLGIFETALWQQIVPFYQAAYPRRISFLNMTLMNMMAVASFNMWIWFAQDWQSESVWYRAAWDEFIEHIRIACLSKELQTTQLYLSVSRVFNAPYIMSKHWQCPVHVVVRTLTSVQSGKSNKVKTVQQRLLSQFWFIFH